MASTFFDAFFCLLFVGRVRRLGIGLMALAHHRG